MTISKTIVGLLFFCSITVARVDADDNLNTNGTKIIKPMVANVGMADPHIHIFNNKAYLYSTRDADIQAKGFVMPDWKVWSSSDLIDWKLETIIDPAITYMGKSNNCWAPDMAYRDGNYYFYFSNRNRDTGVLVGKTPTGPFKDVLGKPLLPENLTPTKEYDPTILMEDDEAQTSYIAFGHFRPDDPVYYYAIAKLGSDMISLAEEPKEIKITGNAPGLKGNDKPTLHKRNGVYYLSAGTSYATSDNVYGPYVRRGYSANRGEFGLDNYGHGDYFEWNNQWFHTWCHFYMGKNVARYRQSYVNYLHYKDNGEMVDDVDYLEKHGEIGIGQYDANWDKIEAEWYMASSNIQKKENTLSKGFSIQEIQNGGYLYFPNVKNIKPNSQIVFSVASLNSGVIEVRKGSATGALVGACEVKSTGAWDRYQDVSCELKDLIGEQNLYFVFKGGVGNLFNVDSFAFKPVER